MNGYLKKLIEKHGMQLVVQILSIFIGVLIAYFGIKQDIESLRFQVQAIEKGLTNRPNLIERFFKVEQKIDNLVLQVKKLQNKVNR